MPNTDITFIDATNVGIWKKDSPQGIPTICDKCSALVMSADQASHMRYHAQITRDIKRAAESRPPMTKQQD